MDTVLTARHCEIAPELRERAAAVLERLGALAGRAVEGAAVFSLDAGLAGVELRLNAPGRAPLVAAAGAADHRTALDRAEEKLKTQVARASGRSRGGRHSAELPQV